jgi:membrane fusion protein, macrolide-specific efflux system
MNASRFVLVAAALALAACSHSNAEHTPASTAAVTPAYAAIARGQVDVEGGLIKITAPRDGRIAELHGEPGIGVKSGDVLAKFDTHQAELNAGVAQAEVDQAQAHATALRTKVAGVKLRAERAAEAAQAGAATQQAADDAKQVQAELNAEIGEADAALEASKQKLKQARHEVDVLTLRAPVDARVVARTAHLADVVSVQSNAALFTLLPDAPRIVRAELNEAFLAKVAVGMSADVTAEDGSDKVYKATITRIGDVFGPSKLTEEAQEASDTRDVECILRLDSDALRVGQRVQVRFKGR